MVPTPSQTITKLLVYTFFMFAAPLATYKISQDYALPALYERSGWTSIADAGGRAVWSGFAAIVAVNLVLVAYVISALAEEGTSFGRGGVGERVRGADDEKAD